ncbi:MAG: hypothetical protein CMP48_24755 [Rickettsiales bacterium]|nr:hypothetical protein [Rickettsiales bacterium]
MCNHRFWMCLGILFLSVKLYSQDIHHVHVNFPNVPDCVLLSAESQNIIYPNPTSQYLKIPEKSEFKLFDVSGKKVDASIDSNGQLDMSQLSNGLYILHMVMDNRIRTIKVIKE